MRHCCDRRTAAVYDAVSAFTWPPRVRLLVDVLQVTTVSSARRRQVTIVLRNDICNSTIHVHGLSQLASISVWALRVALQMLRPGPVSSLPCRDGRLSRYCAILRLVRGIRCDVCGLGLALNVYNKILQRTIREIDLY